VDLHSTGRIHFVTQEFFSELVDELCLIVEKETELDFPQPDGSTKRKHLQMVAKQTGKIPPELEVPDVPPPMMFVKYCFDSLSMYRKWEDGSPTSLSPQDIYYWQKIDNTHLSPKHLRAVKKLDIVQLNMLVRLLKERRSG
jgi:hypothetical protein